MICYNRTNWFPFNPSIANGYCRICDAFTRSDTECPVESEVNTDEEI